MPGIDIKENTIRIRQKNPNLFEKGTFKTIVLKSGVKAVVGRLKGKKSTSIQTLLFDKDKFDASQAKAWVKEHMSKYTEDKIIKVKNKMEFSKTMLRLDEVNFAESGKWKKESINGLPDTSFAIVADGVRKYPYMDASGNIDLPHLRNALFKLNQPTSDLTPEQKQEAKTKLMKIAKKYLKTYGDKATQKMSDDGFEDIEFTQFEEEDIFSKLKFITFKLEQAKTIEEVKTVVSELKELTKDEEDTEDGEEEKQETSKQEKQEEPKKEVIQEPEKVAEVKVTENSDNSQLSEAFKLNEKILFALKESEDEIDRLKKEVISTETKFKEQIDVLGKINEKRASDFDELAKSTLQFVNIINEQKLTKFNEKVEKVSIDYCKFMNIPNSEIANVRQTMSKWSDDMIEQTAKAVSAKRTKMAEKEPVALTTASSQLRESTAFSSASWEEMTPETKTDYLHKLMVEQNKINK